MEYTSKMKLTPSLLINRFLYFNDNFALHEWGEEFIRYLAVSSWTSVQSQCLVGGKSHQMGMQAFALLGHSFCMLPCTVWCSGECGSLDPAQNIKAE